MRNKIGVARIKRLYKKYNMIPLCRAYRRNSCVCPLTLLYIHKIDCGWTTDVNVVLPWAEKTFGVDWVTAFIDAYDGHPYRRGYDKAGYANGRVIREALLGK